MTTDTSEPQPAMTITEIAPPPLSPRVRRFAMAAIATASAATMIGTALSPVLAVKYPLLLVALSAELRHLILAAGRVNTAELIAVGSARRVIGMCCTYAFGAIWGFAVVRWAGQRSPRTGAVIAVIERIFGRVGLPLLLVIPSYTLCMLAGAARISVRAYLLTVIIGQIATTWVTVWFGDVVSAWTSQILDFLSAHLLSTTLIAAVIAVITHFASRRQGNMRT